MPFRVLIIAPREWFSQIGRVKSVLLLKETNDMDSDAYRLSRNGISNV